MNRRRFLRAGVLTGGTLLGRATAPELGAPPSGTPGRNKPTTGEIDYQHVFAHLYEKGYDGLVGMEHGMSGEGTAGEQAVIDAYISVDSFETAGS